MALQSQTLRGSSNVRSSGSPARQGRSGQKRLVGLALLVLILGGGFMYLVRNRDGGGGAGILGPQSAKGASADGVTLPVPGAGAQGALAPTSNPAGTQGAPKLEPMVLQMGSRQRLGGGGGVSSPTSTLPAFTAATKPGAATTSELTAATPPTSLTPVPATGAMGTSDQSTPLPGIGSGGSPSAAQPGADASGLSSDLGAVQASVERAVSEKRLVDARSQLNKALVDPRVSDRDREGIRKWMADLNKDLFFSATAYPSDSMVEMYTVQKGDSPIKISRKVNSVSEYGLIVRVNGINPSALSVGKQLKIVKGPFHAVVSKSAFRMDIYQGPTPATASIGTSGLAGGAEPGWTYIRSFPVGLGEKGVTPLGAFTVKEGSKMINPPWTNPHTGEHFGPKDPKNPIGLRWVGLQGLDEKTKGYNGYGIHATIAPDSIGKEMSMGCVRMNEEDVDVVYDMLMARVSVVKIVP